MSEDPTMLLLNQPTVSSIGMELFGCTSTIKTLTDAIQLLKSSHGRAKMTAAAYGMLVAINTCREGGYRVDALHALDQLALAKALIDQAACHLRPVIDVTAEILYAAQVFADEATIPCTEWPYVAEIASVVRDTCQKYAPRSDER